MTGPHPSVAATRLALRRVLSSLIEDEMADLVVDQCRDRGPRRGLTGGVVLVACSGGPDSMALVAATGFEAPKLGITPVLVTVDHGWTADSADRARALLDWAGAHGIEATSVRLPDHPRTETAARALREQVLTETAQEHGDVPVLLGHTRDDQAETVLLGLARGSGARSLAGMPGQRWPFVRPFLQLPREVVHEAAEQQGLPVWHDPSNADRRHARARVRHDALPALATALGQDPAAALARTASLLQQDADLLDELTDQALLDPAVEALEVAALARLHPALRGRVLHRKACDAGSPRTDLTAGHVSSVDALVTAWAGQRFVVLPGRVRAERRGDRITLTTPEQPGA